jgi:hypothetical protein
MLNKLSTKSNLPLMILSTIFTAYLIFVLFPVAKLLSSITPILFIKIKGYFIIIISLSLFVFTFTVILIKLNLCFTPYFYRLTLLISFLASKDMTLTVF